MAGGLRSDLHRVDGRAALGPFLPLALEVEERVVDADGHADQHDHAGDGGSACTRCESGAIRPIVAATLVPARSTGNACSEECTEREEHQDQRQREAERLGGGEVFGDAVADRVVEGDVARFADLRVGRSA